MAKGNWKETRVSDFTSSIFHSPFCILSDGYVPFVYPLPVWDYWPWLLIPLAMAVSIVYKAVKCQSMTRVPREAVEIFVFILIGLAAAAGALAGVVKIMER